MEKLTKNIVRFYSFNQTPLKLNLLYHWSRNMNNNKILKQSVFIKNEISIRLAHRIQELEKLPIEIRKIDKIQNVINLYVDSFDKLITFKNLNSYTDCIKLTNEFEKIISKHSSVPLTISEGIQNWKSYYPDTNYNINFLLDNFYLSRIGIRTLIEHHISIFENKEGIITKCYPQNIINEAIDEVTTICNYNYLKIPNINIINKNNISFTYIKSHLIYVIVEILKNSIRSTVECNKYLQDINIIIDVGKKDVIIKISDKGGGFSRNLIDEVFSYTFTTATLEDKKGFRKSIPIAGYGHGLPLSRLYCRYFHGDIQIIPFEGIGTDVFIYINKLGIETEKIV